MPALSEHVNVFDTALEVLRAKGFKLWRKGETFYAERDGWDFIADGPISLLGLVAIFEHVSPAEWTEYWWKIKGPLSYRSLPNTFSSEGHGARTGSSNRATATEESPGSKAPSPKKSKARHTRTKLPRQRKPKA